MTDEEHNRYIAYTFLAYGAFQVLMLLAMGLMFMFMFSVGNEPGQPGPPLAFFGAIFLVMFMIQMMFTAPSFVAAYALLKRKSWARIASIVAGVLSAMSVPVGTAACVYSLWFFLGDRWKAVYPGDFEPAGRETPGLAPGSPSNEQTYEERSEREFAYEHREPPDWR